MKPLAFYGYCPNSTTIDEVSGRKKRPAGIGRNLGVSGAAFFLVAASLNVSILWLEVAIASKKFKKINNPQLSKKYQLAVIIFDVVAAISIDKVPNDIHEKNKVKDLLYLIRETAIRYVIIVSLWLIVLLIGALEYPTVLKRAWPRGGILYFGVLLDIGFFLPVIAISFILRYLQQISHGKTNQVTSQKTVGGVSNEIKKDDKLTHIYPSE